jgi:hypothetical protein
LTNPIVPQFCGPAESAPENRGTPKFRPVTMSGGGLGRLDLQNFAGARDRYCPRLHRLRNLAYEVDVQEPVLEPCALDHNMVGKLEAGVTTKDKLPTCMARPATGPAAAPTSLQPWPNGSMKLSHSRQRIQHLNNLEIYSHTRHLVSPVHTQCVQAWYSS